MIPIFPGMKLAFPRILLISELVTRQVLTQISLRDHFVLELQLEASTSLYSH